MALHAVPSEAQDPDARLFTAHALAFRAAGVLDKSGAAEVLANIPGAAPFLWRLFFENALVKLGRVRALAPAALYCLTSAPMGQAGAKVDLRAPDGATALFIAAVHGHSEVISLLMKGARMCRSRGLGARRPWTWPGRHMALRRI